MRDRAPFGVILALTVLIALALCTVAISAVMLLAHPTTAGLGALGGLVNQQPQGAKSALYLAAFALFLPFSIWLGPRSADLLASRMEKGALATLVALLAASFAGMIVVVRLSAKLPWRDGLATLLVASALWTALAAAAVWLAINRQSTLRMLEGRARAGSLVALVALFAAILCVTPVHWLALRGLLVGGAGVAIGAWIAHQRRIRPGPGAGAALDVVAVVIVLLAIPNLLVFTTSAAIPNKFIPPGIIQVQQNWILGPVNQVLHGGTLLVDSPASQYGVGLIYFLGGWFRMVPIGYGTFGFLDGVLTAAFYATGYCVLRAAGVRRPLAVSTLTVAILTLIYNLHYPIGQLPEQGPLRFGLPIALILLSLFAARGGRLSRAARVGSFVVLGISSIWALEAFGYTLLTFLALSAARAILHREPGERRRWVARELALAAAVCVCAQVLFAAATLIAAGKLPDWGQYFAYLHSLLAGSAALTYGFARWSPVLAVGAATLASAAALVLLLIRAPAVARLHPHKTLALAGLTGYAIALFSYSDNRSSTYLLGYVALPILLAGALWLSLLVEQPTIGRWPKGAAVGTAGAIAALMLGAAWPSIRTHFNNSALAHLRPGGGFGAAVHRLWHPPPVDPRAPAGERLLARYLPALKVVIAMPDTGDLGSEILLRSGRANRLFVGYPQQDSLVPSLWMAKLTREVRELPLGTRLLMNPSALRVAAVLRARPQLNPVTHPVQNGLAQTEWILREIVLRFRLIPVATDPSGLTVVRLAPLAASR